MFKTKHKNNPKGGPTQTIYMKKQRGQHPAVNMCLIKCEQIFGCKFGIPPHQICTERDAFGVHLITN